MSLYQSYSYHSLTDANGVSLVMSNGPFFSGSTQGSSAGTLLAGETATYRAYYIISDAAAATGLISNIATATASSPGQTNNVSDTSDDGDDTDGNTTNDPTEVSMNPILQLKLLNSWVIDTDNDNINDTGDVIVYTITVNNAGNLLLTNVSIADTKRWKW